MLYVIAERDDMSVIKIGVTNTGSVISQKAGMSRLSSLQVGTWRELVLVAMCPGDNEEENRLHRRFREQWVRGEWFRNEGPVAEWLSTVVDGGPTGQTPQHPPPEPIEHAQARRINRQKQTIEKLNNELSSAYRRIDELQVQVQGFESLSHKMSELERKISRYERSLEHKPDHARDRHVVSVDDPSHPFNQAARRIWSSRNRLRRCLP